MNIKTTEWESEDWTYLMQDRQHWKNAVNTVMEHDRSIKRGEFLDQLRTCQLPKKDFTGTPLYHQFDSQG